MVGQEREMGSVFLITRTRMHLVSSLRRPLTLPASSARHSVNTFEILDPANDTINQTSTILYSFTASNRYPVQQPSAPSLYMPIERNYILLECP